MTAPNSTNLPPGSFRCGQDCATCPYITNGLKHYTFSSTGETRNITSHITCNTKNLIYMVQCNRYHLQYIGETKRRLKDRFNEHRRLVDKTNILNPNQPLFLNIFFLNLTTATLTCNLYHLNLSTPHVIQSEKPPWNPTV